MSNTVSLEMAKRLAASGLTWEPKLGDWFNFDNKKRLVVHIRPKEIWCVDENGEEFVITKECLRDAMEGIFLWLPTTDDLLKWLENKGHRWVLSASEDEIGVLYTLVLDASYGFTQDTPPDSAGEAVLWVLEQEAQHA